MGYAAGAIGKRIIDLMFAGDVRHAHEIAQEKDWLLIADTSIIEPAVDATILEQSNEVLFGSIFDVRFASRLFT